MADQIDPIERELRNKLRGLRISQSQSFLVLRMPPSKAWAKKYRAKLAEVKRAIREVERQIVSYQRQKKATPRRHSVKQPAKGRSVAVVGDVYRFLATGEDTNGKYAMWEALVLPGGGPPPHIHSREEESFYVLEGEITFQVGDERLVLKAGAFANMPVGTLHSFKNESRGSAKMLISVAPAGLEKMFFEVGVPLAEGATSAEPPTKKEIKKLVAIAPRFGIEIRLPSH